MRIGILCATPEEMAALQQQLGAGCVMELGGFQFFETERCVYVQTGIGKINAAAVTALLIARFGVSHVIFAGVAGALNPALHTGDLVFGVRVATHDYGRVTDGELIAYPSGSIPIGPGALEAVPEVPHEAGALLALLAERMAPQVAAQILLGTVITGDTFLNCTATGQKLAQRLGADAVDMESAAVVQVAARFGCPAYILRSISDSADDGSAQSYAANALPMAQVAAACVLELCALIDSRAAPSVESIAAL